MSYTTLSFPIKISKAKALWLSLLVLSLSFLQAKACGPTLFTDQARFSIFNKDMISDMSFAPFQYTHNEYDAFDQSLVHSYERNQNVAEWQAIATSATPEHIYLVQYEMDNKTFQKKIAAKANDNSFIKWLLMPANKPYLTYMTMAKKMEQMQDGLYELDGWEELFQKKQIDALFNLGMQFKAGLPKVKTTFLKERYAFQVVKAYYYQHLYSVHKVNAKEGINIYDQYLAKSSSIVSQWAMLYYSGIQNSPYHRAKYLLLAFDASKEKRFRAYKLIEDNDLHLVSTHDMDTKLQEVYLAVKAMRTTGQALSMIQDIYALNPQSKYLPLLINREVNKLEDWVWSPKVLRFHSVLKQYAQFKNKDYSNYGNEDFRDTTYAYYAVTNLANDISYGAQLANWLKDNAANDLFMSLAAAHAYLVVEQPKIALGILNGINKPSKPAFAQQYLVDKTVATILSEDILKPNTQQKLYDLMDEIKALGADQVPNLVGEERNFFYNINSTYAQLMTYLGQNYINHGDRLTGILLLNKAQVVTNDYVYPIEESGEISYAGLGYFDQYALPEDIDSYRALKKRSPNSQFETLLMPKIWLSDEMLLDLKGTMLARQGKYDQALATFELLDNNFWQTKYEFNNYLPKQSVTLLGHLMPIAADALPYAHVGKKEITKEILQLQQAIASSKDNNDAKAELIYKLANAMYNISYYGKAWMYTAYGKTESESYKLGSEPYDDYDWAYYRLRPTGSNNIANYYGVAEAKKLYEQALAMSSNQETKAQLLTMLAHCDDLNKKYNEAQANKSIVSYNMKVEPSQYWKELAKGYSGTQFYQIAITECPDVRKSVR